MGGINSVRAIGDEITTRVSIRPQSLSGSSAVNGVAINRLAIGNPQSCVLHHSVGASTGAPSSYSVTTKLQHAPDNGSGSPGAFADFDTGLTALTADNTEAERSIDLSGANQWVRAVSTPAFTGGTSPTAPAESSIVFGGTAEQPSIT